MAIKQVQYVAFRGTLTSSVSSILKHGIKSDGLCTYLASTEKGALDWAKALHGTSVKVSVVQVKQPRMSTTHVIQVHGNIPAKDILGVTNY